MKKNFQAAYLPIGVGTFHLESAQKLFEASKDLIAGLAKDLSAGRAQSGAAGEQAERDLFTPVSLMEKRSICILRMLQVERSGF